MSGSTAKRPNTKAKSASGASSVSDFKKVPEATLLPSGNRMVIRPVSVMTFMKTGQIPNSLMPILQRVIGGKDEDNDEATLDVVRDPKKLQEMLELVDRYVCMVAMSPRVYKNLPEDQERDPEALYADELEDNDKMFIFQLAIGGTRDAEQFRTELASNVGIVPKRQDVVDKA